MSEKEKTSSEKSSRKAEGIKKGSHVGEALNESSLPDFKHTPKPPEKPKKEEKSK